MLKQPHLLIQPAILRQKPNLQKRKIDQILEFTPMDNSNYEWGIKSRTHAFLRSEKITTHQFILHDNVVVYCISTPMNAKDNENLIRQIASGDTYSEEPHYFEEYLKEYHRKRKHYSVEPNVWLKLYEPDSSKNRVPFYWSMQKIAIDLIFMELTRSYGE